MTGKICSTLICLIFIFTGFARSEEIAKHSADEKIVSDHAGEHEAEELKREKRLTNQLARPNDQIYKLTMRSGVVFKLQTAVGYFSTIDLPEPAQKVFAGDQDYFKIGVYEAQVVVKPVTDYMAARTNLIIITASGRLAFDVSVGPAETADFVLDFRLPESDEVLVRNAFQEKVEAAREELRAEYEAKKGNLKKEAETLAEEKLKTQVAESTRNLELKTSETEGHIQVNLLSLSQLGSRGYLRFSILNFGTVPLRPDRIFLGAYRIGKSGWVKKRTEGVVELPSEFELVGLIQPEAYVYGVISFNYRPLAKNEKPFLRIEDSRGNWSVELADFKWFED